MNNELFKLLDQSDGTILEIPPNELADGIIDGIYQYEFFRTGQVGKITIGARLFLLTYEESRRLNALINYSTPVFGEVPKFNCNDHKPNVL